MIGDVLDWTTVEAEAETMGKLSLCAALLTGAAVLGSAALLAGAAATGGTALLGCCMLRKLTAGAAQRWV